jgi:glycopeptide antibiotics resistance protein
VIKSLLREAALLGFVVVPLSVVLSLSGALASRRSKERKSLAAGAVSWCFTVYVILVDLLTLAPPPLSRSNGLFGANIVPVIYSIRCFVPNPGQPSTTAFCLRTITGNLVMFVPLGIMLPLLSERWASAKVVLTAALMASVSIELLQYAERWLGSPRWSDIDDVLLNVTGALLGYGLVRLARVAGRWLKRPVA